VSQSRELVNQMRSYDFVTASADADVSSDVSSSSSSGSSQSDKYMQTFTHTNTHTDTHGHRRDPKRAPIKTQLLKPFDAIVEEAMDSHTLTPSHTPLLSRTNVCKLCTCVCVCLFVFALRMRFCNCLSIIMTKCSVFDRFNGKTNDYTNK